MIAIFPKIAGAVASGDQERVVCLVREYFSGERAYRPVCELDVIAKGIGLVQKRRSMKAQAILATRDEGGRFESAVFINEAIESDLELRFLLGHLIGYYLFEVQPLLARGEFRTSGYQISQSPLKRFEQDLQNLTQDPKMAKREVAADQFAAALLLPRGMLVRAHSKLADEKKLAAFFGVSPHLLRRRLELVGLVEQAPPSFLASELQLQDQKAETKSLLPSRQLASHSYKQNETQTGMERLREIARQLGDKKASP